MKKTLKGLIFFIGWILSPFTWWNDAFVNMPLSYLMANILFFFWHLSFKWLVIGSYWLTNAAGILFMYFGGKEIVLASKNRPRAVIILILALFIYSAVIIYLDEKGTLVPLRVYFERFCVKHN